MFCVWDGAEAAFELLYFWGNGSALMVKRIEVRADAFHVNLTFGDQVER